MSSLLPEQFKDLEHLVAEWAIEDGHQRYLKRVSCSMDQLKAFYDEVFPRGKAAIEYVDQFDYQKPLPADAANLRNLIYSLITVALAVEVWKQPRVKHSAKTVLTRLS
ncbi:MAG TPA: hypothetical protein VFM32_04740 [Spongiibacteraceae bacterium]|nr:hypothetical protein [Spongiibacteraceae bacterium]